MAILDMGWANEKLRYIVTTSLIGWAQTQNDPYIPMGIFEPTNRNIVGLNNGLPQPIILNSSFVYQPV